MQPATATPRNGLSENAILTLLTATPAVEIRGGIERYNSSMEYVEDLSGNLQAGSSVTSDCMALIHRSCTIVMDADTSLNYLSDYVKPYVVMTDNNTGFTARFNLGVYQLTSPTPDLTLSPGVSTYSGFDLLQILNQPIGNTYEIAVGVDPIAAASALITAAFAPAIVSLEASGITASVVYSWPLDSGNQWTYLDIINGLLSIAGFAPVWVDWNGVFQLHRYVDPTSKLPGRSPVEWVFDLTPDSINGSVVAESRSTYQDLYDVPNVWVGIMNNLSAAPVEGATQFTFTDWSSPITGITARGRVIRKVMFIDAADYTALVSASTQQIERDIHTVEAFAISTWPIPLFWHRDIVQYTDPSLATLSPALQTSRRALVKDWSLPLDAVSGNMTMILVTLTSVTTAAFADA